MGPIALFDKSFIQSLSTDEAVWFDHFFLSNICPIFYVETLADLSKELKGGRNPEHLVSSIADRTPEIHGSPCVHHSQLCQASLLGYDVPLTGRIPLAGGRPVQTGDHRGVVFVRSPEAQAFHRWQQQRFYVLERDFASDWRTALSQTNLKNSARKLEAIGCPVATCRSLDLAAELARSTVDGELNTHLKLTYLSAFLGLKKKQKEQVLSLWRRAGCKPLRLHAPYAAHILEVEIFFQLALTSSLISSDRPSNRIDIAYLYYLPFAHFLVSSDKLHRSSTEALVGPGRFVWGPDLKKDLQAINLAFHSTTAHERESGLSALAPHPPDTAGSLVVELWDRFIPAWRRIKDAPSKMSETSSTALARRIQELPNAPSATGIQATEIMRDPPSITIERHVRAQRGSWWQLPKSVTEKNRSG
jgi:hypothetical protein